jgi:hypothetical protein
VFADVDETLRVLLVADMPIERNEIDVSFDRPTREWSSRLSKPTLNLFLADIRELRDYRNEQVEVVRTENGAIHRRPMRRVDLTYLVTAWAREPADEHRILAAAMSSMYRQYKVDAEFLQGPLVDARNPLLVRIMPPDYLVKPADFWGAMDNELHASITWVATAPLDPWTPIEHPLVRTAEVRYRDIAGERVYDSFVQIAGVVYRDKSTLNGVEGATVRLEGTALRKQTDADGLFAFAGVPKGAHRLVVEGPDGKVVTSDVEVPAPSYDVEL